jgi:hypothetical protein
MMSAKRGTIRATPWVLSSALRAVAAFSDHPEYGPIGKCSAFRFCEDFRQ